MSTERDIELAPGALFDVARRVGRNIDCDPKGREVRSPEPLRARVAFACSRFNGGITIRLLDGALDALDEAGIDLGSTVVVWVPGAFELPLAASELARSGNYDAVVALGAVVRGETAHFDFVAGQCAAGLARVCLDSGVPVVFGVLTTENVDQALARSEPKAANKGAEAALVALEMVELKREIAGLDR